MSPRRTVTPNALSNDALGTRPASLEPAHPDRPRRGGRRGSVALALAACLACICGWPAESRAAPSWGKVKADVKKDFTFKRGAKVKFKKVHKWEKQRLNGSRDFGWQMEVSWPLKDNKGVWAVQSGTARYHKPRGSKWRFTAFGVGDSWVSGMPSPERSELPVSKAHVWPRNSGLVEVHSITFPEPLAPHWHTVNSVTVVLSVVYSLKYNRELTKFEHTVPTRFTRKRLKAPFTKVFMAMQGKRRVVSSRPWTAKDMTAIERKKAEALNVSVTIPKFSSAMQLCRFMFDSTKGTTSDDALKAILYRLYPKLRDPGKQGFSKREASRVSRAVGLNRKYTRRAKALTWAVTSERGSRSTITASDERRRVKFRCGTEAGGDHGFYLRSMEAY